MILICFIDELSNHVKAVVETLSLGPIERWTCSRALVYSDARDELFNVTIPIWESLFYRERGSHIESDVRHGDLRNTESCDW